MKTERNLIQQTAAPSGQRFRCDGMTAGHLCYETVITGCTKQRKHNEFHINVTYSLYLTNRKSYQNTEYMCIFLT